MNTKPKVALITVYHNRRNHVVNSIKSLLEQTYDNLEIIIVDDYSTDDTFEILEATINNSSRVKLLRNKINKGFTQTLIDTIKTLDTDYIAIHGAGDISLASRIEEQVNYLINNPNVGMVTVDITNTNKPKFHKTEITLKDLLKKNRITHGAVLFKKDVYYQVGGYRSFFTTRQDKDLWFRMSLITQIHFLNRKLYKIIKINNSVSSQSSYSVIPTYLSEFSRQLIKERIKYKTDSLDLIGPNSGLLFNPNKANKLFGKLLFRQLISFRFKNSKRYLMYIIKNNANLIILISIFILVLIFLYNLK